MTGNTILYIVFLPVTRTTTKMPNKATPKKESGSHDRNGGTDLLFSYLRERILSGALTVGSSLPSERDLAVQLGVSRPVLREALRALAMIGAVEIRHGAGTLLRRPDASSLSQFFAFSTMYDVPLAEDITEARIAVECQTGRLAIKRATASDFEALEVALGHIESTIDDPESGAEADYAFHCALVAAAHAPVLSALYSALTESLHSTHLYRRRSVQ
ncbi:MAG: FadR family transcriptional regulator, partial [Candidatus Accumulibacter sp.]|nr:FadR family transcriptional regulator [Accumulibacter sp.]